MLPYDGIIRTGSKGVSHFVTKTPSEGRKVLESLRKGKQALLLNTVNKFHKNVLSLICKVNQAVLKSVLAFNKTTRGEHQCVCSSLHQHC